MAVTVIAGIASALGAAAAQIGAAGFFATLFSTAGAAAFAIGAGLSLVSRALAPKPSLGNQMRGITTTTREPAGSRKLVYGQMRVGGQVVFISHSGTDNKYLHMAIAFASHEIESYEEIWFNDKKVWTASGGFQSDWGTYVTIDRKYGTTTQTASTQLKNAHTLWTDNHKLLGIAYVAFKLEWNQDKFPQGVPNITAVIKGKKVYDPRDTNQSASDSTTWTYSTNPALCLRDYLVDSNYGLGEDRTLIDETVLDATADLCDETQENGADIYSTSGQKRYTLNGVIDTQNSIKDNIEQLLSAMGGRLTFSGGKYFIEGAEYKTPTVTLDESVVISEIQTQTKQSRRAVYNGVKGIFVSEEKNYKVLDYPAQISSTYATEDGDPIYLDMPLPFVTNNLQAQLLAKIALLKSRQQTTLSMTVNLTGLKLKVGDTVMVTNSRLGYSSKVFEVIDYTLANSPGGELGVQLQLLETASAVYDWTSSDEEDFLSGDELDLYDGRTVDNVTSLTGTEIGLRGPDGGVSSSIQLSWTAPDDAFIEYYTVRYNKNGTTDYFEIETRETNLLISGLDVTSNYDFRVQAQNLLGVRSTGTSITNRALNGDTTAPSAPTGVTLTAGINQITCEWTNPTDIDYAFTEVHVSHQSGTPATNATPTAKVSGEEYIATGLSQHTRFFHLRAVDFSGNRSAYTTQQSATALLADSDDIADDAIGNDQIADGAVDTDQIADDAVDITKIANTLESTNYSQGSAGWKLTTDGTFEAGNGTFRGALTATSGSIANSVTIGSTAASTVESGAAAGATALQNGDDITDGTVGGVTITSTKLYQGTGTFNNSNTGFYLDNTGQFSLKDKLSFNGTTLNVEGAIAGGSLQANTTTPIPTNVFTRSSNQNIPTGNESGTFMDLSSGSFVFGDADSFISFAENASATAFELDIKGVLAPTKLDLAGVTDTTVMPSTIKASAYTDASIGKAALSDEAYDEIARRVGNTGGFYTTATGFYLGSTKNIELASAPDHGTQDVRVRVAINDVFTAPVNFAANTNGVKITVKLFAKKTTDSAYLSTHQIGTTQTFVASPTILQYATRYTIDESYEVTLASGVDIEDSTDYDFKVELTRLANPNAFQAYGSGGANDSTGTPVTLEVSEGTTVVAGTGNANTLDSLDSTQFLRSDTDDTFDGDLTITGQLILQGSIDQYNVTDLDVTDKTITVNSGNTQSLSDGAGLIVDRGTATDASLTWNENTDLFNFSNGIEPPFVYLEDQNGTVSSLFGIYAWDDELQFTKRNLSTRAWQETLLSLDYTTEEATFSGAITSSGQITARSDFVAADSGGTARGYLFGTSSGLFLRYNSGTSLQIQEAGSTKVTIGSGGNATFVGAISWSGGSSTNANTAYSWGDHSTQGYLTSSSAIAATQLTGTINNNRLSSDVLITDGGTYSTGFASDLDTITGFRIHRVTGFTGTDHRAFTGHHNLLQLPNTSSSGPYEVQLAFTTVSSGTPEFKFRSSAVTWSDWVKVFNDGYHPNADKWTTARTLTLTGDVTGSVSWDGSSNVTMTTTGGGGAVDSIANFANNRVITASDADSLNGEANLTFDGSKLLMLSSSAELGISRGSARTRKIVLWDNNIGNDYQFYGFGVEGSAFITSIYDDADTFYWYAGLTSTTRQLAMSLSGTGNLTATNNITANGSFITATVTSAQGIYAGSTQVFEGSTRNLKNIGAISASGNISTTGGKLIIKSSSNGFARIEGTDTNHMIIMRGNRDSTTTGIDQTTYYQYGGTRATGKGHLFYTGGALASQTLKLAIHNDAIAIHQPLYYGSTLILGSSLNISNVGTYTTKQQSGYYLTLAQANSTPDGTAPILGVFNNSNIASATFGWGLYDSSTDGALELYNRNNSTTGTQVFKISRGGNIIFGGSGSTQLRTRHVDGKSATSDAYGPLYLNYSSTSAVQVGQSGNNSDLNVYGAIQSSGTTVIDSSRNITGAAITATGKHTFTGDNSTDGTLRIVPDSNKGNRVSHAHYGANGDWYIRSASGSGSVIIQDGSGVVSLGTISSNITFNTGAEHIIFGGGGTAPSWSAPKVFRTSIATIGISDYSGVQLGGYNGTAYGPRLTVHGTGNVDILEGALRMGTTTVIDSSRNATFDNLDINSAGTIELKDQNGAVRGTLKADSGAPHFRISTSNNEQIGIYDGTTENIRINGSGDFNLLTGNLEISGTTVIDSSRNLTNILGLYGNSGTLNHYNTNHYFKSTTSNLQAHISDTGIGIGTSPSAALHVRAVTPEVSIQSNDGQSAKLTFGDATDRTRGGIEYLSTDDMKFTTNNQSQAMVIRYTGDIAMGTANPEANLHVFNKYDVTANTNKAGIMLSRTGNTRKWLWSAGVSGVSNDYFAIRDVTAGAYRMIIDTSGNVSINSTSTNQKLYVNGNIRADGHYYVGGSIVIDSSRNLQNINNAFVQSLLGVNDTNTYINFAGSDQTRFYQGGQERARFDGAGLLLHTGTKIYRNFRTLYSGSAAANTVQYIKLYDRGSTTAGVTDLHFYMRGANHSEYSVEVKIHIPTYSGFTSSYGTMDAGQGIEVEIICGGLSTQGNVFKEIIEVANLGATNDNTEIWLKTQVPHATTAITIAEAADSSDTLIPTGDGSGWTTTAPSNQQRVFPIQIGKTINHLHVDRTNKVTIGGSNVNTVNTISSVSSSSTSGGAGTGNKLRLEFGEPSYPNYGLRSIDFGVRGGGYVEMRPNGGGLYMYSPYSDNDQIHLGYGGVALYHSHGGYTQTNDLVMRSVNGFAFQQNNGNNWFRISPSGTLELGSSNTAILTQSRALQNIASYSGGDLSVSSSSYVPLDIIGSNSQYTAIAVKNTGSGDAGIYFDASNGDLAGSDYAFVGQKNSLDFEVTTYGNAGNINLRAGDTNRLVVDKDGYTLFPSLDLAISNVNSSHGHNTYFRGNSTHFVLGMTNGNTFYLNYGNSGGTLYVQGNVFQWNGTTILDASRNLSNIGTATFNGAVTMNSSLNVASTIGIAGVTVIDSSRNVISANITNIGTMSSGSTVLTANYTGGSGDYTNIGNPPLKIVTSSGYARVPVVSANSSISIVHNYETGKDVYWGEPGDTGTYYFRGRKFYINNGDTGIGVTPNSAYKLYVGGHIAQSSGSIFSYGDVVIGQGGLKRGSTDLITGSLQLRNIANADVAALRLGHSSLGTTGAYRHNIESTGSYLLLQRNQAAPIEIWGSRIELRTATYFGSSSDAHGYVDTSGNATFEGNVTAYGSPSDIRLKKNVERIADPIDKVKQLDGVTFDYKKDGSRSTGLIAQQLLKVLPEVVYETKDLATGEEHYAVRYGNVVGLLVEAMKEQQETIESLTKRIEELENGDN